MYKLKIIGISKIYRNHSIIVWRFVAEGLSCTPVKHPILLWMIAFTGVLGIQYVPQLLRLGLTFDCGIVLTVISRRLQSF